MTKATRTVNPLPFEVLGGHRFEDLVRQVLYNDRDWYALEATGRSGSDDGIDILAVEPWTYLEEGDGGLAEPRQWIIQCKNYQRMGPAAVKKVVKEDLEDQPQKPYGYMLVASCDFSAKAYQAFRDEVAKYGIQQSLIWGKGELEDQLFLPKNQHLLKIYFGLSIKDLVDEKPGPPLDLPPRADHFTGREKEIQQLVEDLQPGAVVTITGPGGVGKTALAAEALYRLTARGTKPPDQFPDGVVTYNFDGRPEVDLALKAVGMRLDEAGAQFPEIARSFIARKQAILVLDSTEQADDLDSFLKLRGRCCILVTSRDRGDIRETYQDLDPLGIGEASKLLSAWGGKYIDDPYAANRICELVGGLPLAVRLGGKYLVAYGELASEYLSWLAKTPLEALDQGERQLESVPTLLARSLDQVRLASRQALGVVGLLGLAPFDIDLVAEGMGLERRETRHALGGLVKFGILKREETLYQVSHALIYTYARHKCEKSARSLERLVEEIIKRVIKASLVDLQPGRLHPILIHAQAAAEIGEGAGLRQAGLLWYEIANYFHTIMDLRTTEAYDKAMKILSNNPNLIQNQSGFGWLERLKGR